MPLPLHYRPAAASGVNGLPFAPSACWPSSIAASRARSSVDRPSSAAARASTVPALSLYGSLVQPAVQRACGVGATSLSSKRLPCGCVSFVKRGLWVRFPPSAFPGPLTAVVSGPFVLSGLHVTAIAAWVSAQRAMSHPSGALFRLTDSHRELPLRIKGILRRRYRLAVGHPRQEL